jgi:hypothetical protein
MNTKQDRFFVSWNNCYCSMFTWITLSLDSEGAIQDIRWSTSLLVWLLSSNKDLVFSGRDVPLGIVEHHLLCRDSEDNLKSTEINSTGIMEGELLLVLSSEGIRVQKHY